MSFFSSIGKKASKFGGWLGETAGKVEKVAGAFGAGTAAAKEELRTSQPTGLGPFGGVSQQTMLLIGLGLVVVVLLAVRK